MKKYLCVASLLILNNEIVGWIVAVALAIMALADFTKAIEKEAKKR